MQECASAEEKQPIVKEICSQSSIHVRLEEEILYPAVRDVIDDSDSMIEAVVEHADSKWLIAQLMAMDHSNQYCDTEVTVLSEGIDHHVEKGDMFPKVKKAKITLMVLGEHICEHRKELAAAIANHLKSGMY